ncbi:MAG: cupredoxin domain-containing protein [Candidatus Kerfeldbacteria bacterium]|nr:cupredoxin domain-containing protein [Candidatus Kerfeldbacteria bacterium]
MGLFSTKPVSAVINQPNGAQELTITVRGGYSPNKVAVKVGVLVRLTFDRQEEGDCTEYVVIDEYGINQQLPPFAKTTIEFTPTKVGTVPFHCGMGMVHGKIIVGA